MAVYGRWGKFLTGERLVINKRNIVIDRITGLLIAIVVIFMSSYSDKSKDVLFGWGGFGVIILITLMITRRIMKKQTAWQLRKLELNNGQNQALDILKDLNVEVGNGKK